MGALRGGGSPGDRADSTAAPAASALAQTEERPWAINLKSVRRQNLCQTKAFPCLGKYISAQNRFIPPRTQPLEALKAIGLAYGLYSRAEELRGQRVHLTGDEGHTALVVQEDFSCHGSPCWGESSANLTEDPAEIQQYMAFRDVLRIVQQRDREERLPAKQRTGDSFPEHPPRQGGRSRER